MKRPSPPVSPSGAISAGCRIAGISGTFPRSTITWINYSQTAEERFQRISFLGDESLGSLDSTVRLAKDWSLYNLTALASYTDDFSSPDNDATLQTYPEVILTGFRQPLFGSPLQIEFSAAYVHYLPSGGSEGASLGDEPDPLSADEPWSLCSGDAPGRIPGERLGAVRFRDGWRG